MPQVTTLKTRKFMCVTLADITIVYLALFGERHASDMPYVDAAKAIKHAKPDTWHLLFDAALNAREANRHASYEDLAKAVEPLCGPGV